VSGKLLMAAGIFSVAVTLTIGWLVYLNITNLDKTRASGNADSGGNRLNNSGDILTEFTWEKDPVTKATIGPDAVSSGKFAHAAMGGRASTHGLAPGAEGKDINLVIPSSPLFDQEGIDISIDYRRNEESGSFFTRNGFVFGMNKGFIYTSFRVENQNGGSENVNETTEYEIPMDNIFRNYRFIYNPGTGKAEIFVNSIIVWSYSYLPNSVLSWKGSGDIIIGKNMDGGGKDIPVFDNLVIRSCGTLMPLAETLINFMLEPTGESVRVHWSTSANDRVNEFVIQRSQNGLDFTTITSIKANSQMSSNEEYSFVDKPYLSSPAVLYYRIRQNFKNGKFTMHPLSAVKINAEKGLTIEDVNPVPFGKSFDISYFTPENGRVSIQLTDSKGTVKSSETFETPRGKNVHVFKDRDNLEKGTYILNLIFGDKKTSTTVIKS